MGIEFQLTGSYLRGGSRWVKYRSYRTYISASVENGLTADRTGRIRQIAEIQQLYIVDVPPVTTGRTAVTGVEYKKTYYYEFRIYDALVATPNHGSGTLVLEGASAKQINTPPLEIDSRTIKNNFTMKAFPNPTRDRVMIRLEHLNIGNIHVEISNLQGQRLIQKDYQVNADSDSFEMDVSKLPSGLYILMARQKGIQEISRLVIE